MQVRTEQIFPSDNRSTQVEMATDAAAQAAPVAISALDQIPEFVREIFYPSPLSSFRGVIPSGEVMIHIHRRVGEEPTQVRLINIFPFMTLKDIKLALYLDLKQEAIAIPEYVYLCLHGPEPGRKYSGGMTSPLDFSWNFSSISEASPFRLQDPFKLVSGVADARFVDSGGERRLVSPVDRERMTIEDACFKKGVSRGLPILHAYFYTDLLAAVPGAKPPSEKEWNGCLYPMFPHLSVADAGPTKEQKAMTDRLALVFLRRQQFLVRIESILERDIPLVSLSMAGIKYLQLAWEAKKNIQGIETQFYEANVDERRPFLRLIPTEGTGISKVFLHDGKSPDIQDPKLLVQWSQDRSPTPEQDFVFAKVMLRKGLANVPPIYATLRLFNDGTADCVLEPPKGMRRLEPRNDLENFGEHLVAGLAGLPYLTSIPEIGKGSFVLGLRLRKGEDAIITPRILRERLPVFSSMFQEISALPGEKPMAMLRFKLVSNFAREDRIQTFLTQVIHRKVLRGEGGIADLVELVADEFQIDHDEARKQVAIKLQSQGEVSVVVPETREYMRQNNPGIDVAIFAQHPFYTFHLYNVNSLENLQRIVTALSILMSADSSDLQVGAKAVQQLATAEAFVPEAESDEDAAELAKLEEEQAALKEKLSVVLEPEKEEAEDVGGAEELPDYLDFFAFGEKGDERTLEEEHEAEVAEATRVEGAARPDPPSEDAAAVPTTSHDLRKEIAEASVAPKDELMNTKVQTPAAPPAEDEEVATGETGIANFFLTKLKEADSRLFDYTKSNPSLKRYVSQCQPTYGRQPAVLSEEKFQELQEEYAKDSITFQIYPLQPGEPTKPPGQPEVDYYTVLKYGSSPQRQNYYLCCRYFCTRDEMLVREVDLQSTLMRRPTRRADGSMDSTKRPGECPFCRGRVIRTRRAPGANETILERIVKPPTQDKRHLFIGFIKKTPHPEGFYLPCCFTEEVPIKFNNNRAFDKYREWGLTSTKKPVSAAAAELLEDDEEPVEEEIIAEARSVIQYSTTLNQLDKKYIVGADKLPLDVGSITSGRVGEAQIGLLPVVLNAYFDQDPTQIVTRAFNPQKMKEGATGFLRVAAENRHRFQNDSFLAAIAPFYSKNTAEQMKRHIIQAVQPKEFLALNYGNLAIEFYDPGDSVIKKPTTEALRAWASTYLHVDTQQENEESVLRAYMSYHTFNEWILSDKTKKEYRQFALLFAQSNLLRKEYARGITFIVIDILKDGKTRVRCPPYGFNENVMNKNDVAFLMHHWSGIWEPIFYADNRPHDVREDLYTLVFQYAARGSWPPIVQQRLSEFMTQCGSSGRATYTSHSGIHPLAMIPASLARMILEREPQIIFDGVLRDSYNHIGALLFHERKDATEQHVLLPVVDDGELVIGKTMIMDWEDPALKPAPIDVVLYFYKKYVETRFSYYPGFSPVYIIKSERSGVIEAIQLRNGLYVPVSPPSSELVARQMEGSPTRVVGELEWTKNHDICLQERGATIPGERERMDMAEFQEVFEHLRLTFSNWLASKVDGGEFRRQLETVIFSNRLPLVEKRKRMEILLSREIEKWMTTDFADEDAIASKDVSLLRVDCTLRNEDTCGGRCVWKRDTEKCLLHVPKQTHLGEEMAPVSAARVLLLRLIEELLRYGERRRQLLERDVSRLASLEKPIVIGVSGSVAKQVIYPEKSSAWYELLRLEWAKVANEEPKFLEEMSREQGERLASLEEKTTLPESLLSILNGPGGPDQKTGAIRILRADFDGLLVPLRISAADIGITADTKSLDTKMIRAIVQATGMSVVQIDIRSDPPSFNGGRPLRTAHDNGVVPVFIITEEGPGILVLNPSAPQILKKSDMPLGLLNTIEKVLSQSKGTLKILPRPVKTEPSPPLPAQPAAAPAPSPEPPPPADSA
jgi:hypothetical protein